MYEDFIADFVHVHFWPQRWLEGAKCIAGKYKTRRVPAKIHATSLKKCTKMPKEGMRVNFT